LTGHSNSVDSIRISADEKYLVSAGADGARIVWDLGTQMSITTKPSLRKQRASDVALISGATATRFLSATLPGNSGENALLMLEEFDSDQRRVLLASSSGIQAICSSKEGNRLAVGERDGGVTLLDISDILNDRASPDTVPNIIGRWNAHRERVYCVAFSPSGKHLVTCGKDGNILRWEPGATQSTQYITLDEVAGSSEQEKWTAHAYSDQAQQMFAVSDAPAIDRWDVNADKVTRVARFDPGGTIQTLLVSPDGKRLFISDMHGKIQRFDLDVTSDQFNKSWDRSDPVDDPPTSCNLTLSDDAAILACAYCRNRNVLALFDANTGALIGQHSPLNWLSTDSFGLAISPITKNRDYGRVAYAFGSNVIVVDWIADEASPGNVRFIDERVLESESDTVLNVIFIDHETILATTTRNQLIKWNLGGQSDQHLFSGQTKPLKILRALPDGREVWTASSRNTIMTWCLHTSQNLIDVPITDIGSNVGVRTIGREVTGVISDRKLFWQPMLSRWPAELKQDWDD